MLFRSRGAGAALASTSPSPTTPSMRPCSPRHRKGHSASLPSSLPCQQPTLVQVVALQGAHSVWVISRLSVTPCSAAGGREQREEQREEQKEGQKRGEKLHAVCAVCCVLCVCCVRETTHVYLSVATNLSYTTNAVTGPGGISTPTSTLHCSKTSTSGSI